MKKKFFMGFIALLIICVETAKGGYPILPRSWLVYALEQSETNSFLSKILGIPNIKIGQPVHLRKLEKILQQDEYNDMATILWKTMRGDLKKQIILKGLEKRTDHSVLEDTPSLHHLSSTIIENMINKPINIHLNPVRMPTEEDLIASASFLIEQGSNEERAAIAKFFFVYETRKFPNLVKKLIQNGNQQVYYNLVYYTMNQHHWSDHPDLILLLIERGDQRVRLEIVSLLSTSDWIENEELIDLLALDGNKKIRVSIIEKIFPHRSWSSNKKLFSVFIFDEDSSVREAAKKYAMQAEWD